LPPVTPHLVTSTVVWAAECLGTLGPATRVRLYLVVGVHMVCPSMRLRRSLAGCIYALVRLKSRVKVAPQPGMWHWNTASFVLRRILAPTTPGVATRLLIFASGCAESPALGVTLGECNSICIGEESLGKAVGAKRLGLDLGLRGTPLQLCQWQSLRSWTDEIR
jgi:hypothetical protein